MKKRKSTGVALAVAAAGMFALIPVTGSAGTVDSLVKCFGVNKCKGHNDCKSAHNACKGKVSCKSMGFVKMPTEACEQIGGEAKTESSH